MKPIYSLTDLDGRIRGEQALLDAERRRCPDYFSPEAVAIHKRIEGLEAQRLSIQGSGFGKPPEDRK